MGAVPCFAPQLFLIYLILFDAHYLASVTALWCSPCCLTNIIDAGKLHRVIPIQRCARFKVYLLSCNANKPDPAWPPATWNTAAPSEECDLQNARLPRRASEEGVLYFFHIHKKIWDVIFITLISNILPCLGSAVFSFIVSFFLLVFVIKEC